MSVKQVIILCACIFSGLLSGAVVTHASSTDGTIDPVNRYAWSENAGWIDFGTTLGNVHVTATALTGYAYGENIGWISLNCSNTSSCGTVSYAVSNTTSGVLSGYAWSENAGWIDFAPSQGGVTISSSGVFSGYAYGENIGWINFSTNNPVTTDWRPSSSGQSSDSTPSPTTTSSGSSGSMVSAAEWAKLFGCPAGYVCVPVAPISAPAPLVVPATSITRDLHLNILGADVKLLQQFLNANGYSVARTGPGSSGRETLFFGTLTRSALARFQKEKGISPPVGYFGPKTRSYIKNIYK